MISPTGKLDLRGQDKWGHGGFGKPRGTRVHHGIDFVIDPDNYIYFPFDFGYIDRVAKPYAQDNRYSGAFISGVDNNTNYIAKLFYFQPNLELITEIEFMEKVKLTKGDIIGESQDLTLRYPGIVNHIHLQAALAVTPRIWINPIAILREYEERH